MSFANQMGNFNSLAPNHTPMGVNWVDNAVPYVSQTGTMGNPAGTMGPLGGNQGLGAMGIANLAIGGIGTIGSLLASFGALKLAKKQFAFQKEFSTRNMANQIKSYNTALADRSRSRAAMEGQSTEQAQSYVDQNKLSPMTGG